jgi:hypothetical protein
MTINPEVELTLDDAVAEVLGLLTGLDLTYHPEKDRYRSITRALNRALRANALENEWSYYASTQALGTAQDCTSAIHLPGSLRPRIIDDDAVRLQECDSGRVLRWAYFLPRDALHKYLYRPGLWVSIEGTMLRFSRPFTTEEDGLEIHVPVMREPVMFRLPDIGEEVPDHIREQPVDFAYPDLVISRAAYFYAQTDPVMQPRVQTLEMDYKTLMYQLIERDTRHTDAPYQNDFVLPLQNGLHRDNSANRPPFANY